jgi:hypothetical protein
MCLALCIKFILIKIPRIQVTLTREIENLQVALSHPNRSKQHSVNDVPQHFGWVSQMDIKTI